MTPPQPLHPMTSNEMRIAIATACGWKWVRDGFGAWWFHPPHQAAKFSPEWLKENSTPTCEEKESGNIAGSGARPPWLPDYPADLNACHEMEKILRPDQLWRYADAIDAMP